MFKIVYGSQSGMAKEVAEQVMRAGIRHHYTPEVVTMDCYDMSQLSEELLIVFVCSTTGQGDNPDTMHQFWRFLMQKSLPNNYLNRLKYTIFGLGDSSYEKYNFAAKRLHRRLEQLGAALIHKRGFGDDFHPYGYSVGYQEWITDLWTDISVYIRSNQQHPNYVAPIPDNQLLPPLKLVTSIDPSEYQDNPMVPLIELVNNNYNNVTRQCKLKLISNDRITSSNHNQDVRHLVFSLYNRGDESSGRIGDWYCPGETLYIYPQNSDDHIATILSYLKFSPADRISMSAANEYKGKVITTMYNLFKEHLDVYGKPRSYFFELLSHFAHDEIQRDKLRHFSRAEGFNDLLTYCYKPRRSMLEVLGDFGSCHGNIPLEYLCDLFPAIQPRGYSISSSNTTHPSQLSICVSLLNYKTEMKVNRTGFCSDYLRSLSINEEPCIIGDIRAATLKMPQSTETPMIMVGPGTGIAPFIGFIEHRANQQEHAGALVFGNRYRERDFLFKDRLLSYQTSRTLNLLLTFSRDQPDKQYVQHEIRRQGGMLWDLIHNKNAYIYVCGRTKDMPKDVQYAFLNICIVHGNLTKESAYAYIQRLKTDKRYQLETW